MRWLTVNSYSSIRIPLSMDRDKGKGEDGHVRTTKLGLRKEM